MLKTLLVAVALGGMSAGAQAAIVITEVMSSSAHTGTGNTSNGDWFELTNTGASAVDLTGWSWDDSTGLAGSANFGSVTSISAGQSIIFGEETVGFESAWIADWGTSGVTVINLGGTVFQGLGSTGDSVIIYNASSVVVTSVTFGTATAGFTFEWDTSGQSLALSVLGENGAFRASFDGKTSGEGPGLDIGSPGFAAVPEPSTFAAFTGAAALGLAFCRRGRRSV
ncbi:MAG: lamin tail domain-containing protein [Opitutaceae bacterium]|nr:lamin tail domain-containing protein [Opitutaceae bacterium]